MWEGVQATYPSAGNGVLSDADVALRYTGVTMQHIGGAGMEAALGYLGAALVALRGNEGKWR